MLHIIHGTKTKDICLVDEKDVIYNAIKGVLRNVVIEGTKTNVKNIELYKYILEATSPNDAVIDVLLAASIIRILQLAH